MTVEEGLYAMLTADAGVTSFCGTNVFPDSPPDHIIGTPPWISYQVQDEGPLNTLEILVSTITEVQFDVLAVNYSAVRVGVAALVAALNGKSSPNIQRAHWQGTKFQAVEEGHLAQVTFVVQAKA